ncbi:hypothetical protein PUNSTDRAFT_145708 [Punctularia strigosozonata HHB-11173 SS5]|uniref:uncharacterized protein n=1 Tax=Punctularia strigosozonata (strain HHB-11173) TaxID=741275 RepID=UPI00044171A6|nr:uncharacterized protein PUNSTDRAFT_145708 [Punctularia strigosozonata HHB-11173 SS5]EIN05785.1 hypothetical protein PUNSTDRAFT_145708 [Punctularia strigosozonata HHB-11173 SS5]
MFSKPLGSLKTTAPVRSSDRRKLKQTVVQTFGLQAEEGDLLVPEGLKSVKFTTHRKERGVAYLASDGDPLWFTIGKDEDLIPTVYTLWKHPGLLPFLTTTPAVIPILIVGADLRIAGVVRHAPTLASKQLVCVNEHHDGKLGYPLAVGHMEVDSDKLRSENDKGTAVRILHTWQDELWALGSKRGPPGPMDRTTSAHESDYEEQDRSSHSGDESSDAEDSASDSESGLDEETEVTPLTPEEVSTILRCALLQAIQTTLSQVPSSTFPIPATTFYTTYILPHRPSNILSPTPIDIKHSAFKSLSTFLKACEKDGLLSLKPVKGDVVVTGAKANHPEVLAHLAYHTIEMEENEERRVAREREAEAKKPKEMVVTEIWQPNEATARLFEELGREPSALYSSTEIEALVNDYVATRNLVDPHDQQSVNVSANETLAGVLSSKNGPPPDSMQRADICKLLAQKMQPWHTIQPEGKATVTKEGQLRPISVTIPAQVKGRPGGRSRTLITGFEPFLLDANELAEALRKSCASSATVKPRGGKDEASHVLVRGKHIKPVVDLLQARGVPALWIKHPAIPPKKGKQGRTDQG